MPPPTNTSAATATGIPALPYDITVDLSDVAPATDLHLWWTYTAQPTDVVVSVWATMGAFDDHFTTIWIGAPGALTVYLDFEETFGPIVVPGTAAVTYYLEVALEVPVSPPPLALSVVPGPNAAVPIGALVINDDNIPYPAAVLSPIDGTVLQYRPLPAAGENAALLRSGLSLWEEAAAPSPLRLYDATLTLVTSPAVPGRLAQEAIGSNRVDRFYVAVNSVVQTVTPAGTLGAEAWDLAVPEIRAIDPSPDETVLYYIAGEGLVPVRRWDLVADAALADLAPADAAYGTLGVFGQEIVVLPDGSVIVPYFRASPVSSVLRRYDPSGTLLQTYDLGSVQVNRVTYDPVDEAGAVWVWAFLTSAGTPTGYSRFQSRRVSDGTVLVSFDTVAFTEGQADPAAPTGRFGHARSCPFVALPGALPPYSPPGGGVPDGGGGGLAPPYVAPAYDRDARYIRRLRRAPHVANENNRVFYRRFELDLERGQGLATGQGSDPMVLLRISRDGGQTWGEEQRMAAGKLGAYTQRVIARRLGQARDTVFEVVVSDPIAWALVGAWLDLEPGTN